MMRTALYNWLHRTWYEHGKGRWLLLPLSALYAVVTSVRRYLYSAGIMKSHRVAAPVIVVGNLTAGGTGKTPTTIWLAAQLRQRGFTPGIVSRGYGGSKSGAPMRVDAASDPALVGDEPVLQARRSGCHVAVDRDRVSAAEMLIQDGADLIIADDGLQHLRLQRDYEICVIDGARWLGNGWVLPAGPLRESRSRLLEVDQILVNGGPPECATAAQEQNAIQVGLLAETAVRLNGSLERPLSRFADTTVHAVAAIGNPARFFDMLRAMDIQVIEHAFPDHAPLNSSQLQFADDFEVLMTEKDAVKLGMKVADRFWAVPVELTMEATDAGPWLAQIDSRMRGMEVGE